MEVEQLKKKREIAKAIAIRKGADPQQAEDFAQVATLLLSNGRKSSWDQLFTDFLRSEIGRTDDNGSLSEFCSTRLAETRGYVQLDPNTHFTPVESTTESDLDFLSLVSFLQAQERAYVVLHYKWGLGLKEIGECFGVTEGRICQRLKEIHAKLARILTARKAVQAPSIDQ